MVGRILARPSIGLLFCCLGLGAGALAQAQSDSPQRIEHKRSDLSGASGMEVVVSTAEYKPGESLDLHMHHGVEAAYVIQGATVQAPGKDAMQIPTGATQLFLREVRHAGVTVIGTTSLKLFTVHVVDKGKPLYDYSR